MKRYIRSATTLNEKLAQNSRDPEVLAQLANDANEDVRWRVTKNPDTPVDVLAQLANDESWFVRCGAAGNPNTPADALAQLANDADEDVRRIAKGNPNCPVKPKKSNKWPSADAWYSIESDEEFEDMWSRYLAGPEDGVNKQLQIFPEPSIQGGSGSMVIFDESEDKNESVYIDYQDWCDAETKMASESKSAKGYATKYEIYLKSVVDWL